MRAPKRHSPIVKHVDIEALVRRFPDRLRTIPSDGSFGTHMDEVRAWVSKAEPGMSSGAWRTFLDAIGLDVATLFERAMSSGHFDLRPLLSQPTNTTMENSK